MEYISSDTNVWLDFVEIEKLNLPFQLPYVYLMNDAGEPTPFYKVDVSESWVDAEKDIGPTKERYKRTTVIHEDLVKELIAFAEKYGRSESDLLFASFSKGKSSQPYVKNIFQNYFYDALEANGTVYLRILLSLLSDLKKKSPEKRLGKSLNST